MTAKMNASLAKSLKTVYVTLEEVERYLHASRVLGFDQQTICPPLGMEEQGETSGFALLGVPPGRISISGQMLLTSQPTGISLLRVGL